MVARGVPGFKPNHASLLELGYRYATWEEVTALAAILKVDAAWLAGRSSPAPVVTPPPPKPVAPVPAPPPLGLAAARAGATPPAPAAAPKAPVVPVAVAKVAEVANPPLSSVGTAPPVATKPAAVAPVGPAPAAMPVAAAPVPEARPGNFPPRAVPPSEPGKEIHYRRLLTEELNRANQSLLNKALKPAEWREWRDYQRLVRAALTQIAD